MDSKCGQTVQSTRVSGKTTKLTAMENLFTQMEIFMKASGKTIKHMEMETILMLMEQLIKVNGRMINNMEKERKPGLMEQNTMDSIMKVKSITEVH